MKIRIEEGDKVDVHFGMAGSIFNAEVLYVPCAIGEAFRLKTESGKLVYVQNYDAMYVRG